MTDKSNIVIESRNRVVFYDRKPFSPHRSQQVRNHSPTGFSWGYAGSGPAQLALAILLEFTDSDQTALGLYQHFKFDVIASLDWNFQLTGAEVEEWLTRHKGDRID